jgi:hypothetical protein
MGFAETVVESARALGWGFRLGEPFFGGVPSCNPA